MVQREKSNKLFIILSCHQGLDLMSSVELLVNLVLSNDHSIFVYRQGSGVVILVVYIDDIIMIKNNS